MSDGSTSKVWHLISISVAPAAEEITGAIVFDLGATGTVTLKEEETSLTLGAYFDEKSAPEELARQIEAGFAQFGISDCLYGLAFAEIADQDWMQKWKEGFEPIAIGERLLIAPSWKLPEVAEGRKIIQIDPGMAFGTGTHETTRLCLQAIEKYWRGGTMLDVGTGTGILAIAAALLVEQSHITAIDVDPLAVAIAEENTTINQVEKIVKVKTAQASEYAGRQFNLLVANLTAEVIIALILDLVACLDHSGVMILSGILTILREDVERALRQAGLNIIERDAAGEWSMLVAQRGEG
jgi:ribosomal protein L11 methyltransferase